MTDMKPTENYTENNYGKVPRITNDKYRAFLTNYQVPAIKKHCGDLTGKVFLDIGAGDIVLGEKLNEIGVPKKFYVQDLSKPSILSGLKRLDASGVDISNIVGFVSTNFDFNVIEDGEVDYAFSNSLFSHLTINSITLCLHNLSPKMPIGAKYFSSMIVLPTDEDTYAYDWSYLKKLGTQLASYSIKDPYHYTANTIKNLQQFNTGFKMKHIHDYGHPFQKLVEFERC